MGLLTLLQCQLLSTLSANSRVCSVLHTFMASPLPHKANAAALYMCMQAAILKEFKWV